MVARELTYLDFDVLLERGVHGTYWARVINAPAGQTPPVAFTMPITPLELENFLLRIGRRRRVVRRVDAPETAAIKSFGGKLYRALFHDDLEVNLLRSLSEAAAQQAGLRIRLRLSDTPELAELPWEFLYDQTRNRFLGLSDRTLLVRFLEVPDPPRPLLVSPPLRVLVMIASPSDYPQLDVEEEWTKLRMVLAPLEQASQVQVTRLETATLAALRQQLRRADWHVLHFIGHGGFDTQTQDGVLVLEDQTGRSRLVSGQDLGVLLHDHDPLRLVVLNACEGARADPTDPFAGTAQSLIQQGIPAVVAMQFEITDPAAISFASELYAAVADSYPLDAALAEARKAIWADGNQIEWATPVLHLRAPDGRIFDVASAPVAANSPPTAASTHPPSVSAPPGRIRYSDVLRNLVRTRIRPKTREDLLVSTLIRFKRREDLLVVDPNGDGLLTWDFDLEVDPSEDISELTFPVYAESSAANPHDNPIVVEQIEVNGRRRPVADVYRAVEKRSALDRAPESSVVIEYGLLRVPVELGLGRESCHVKVATRLKRALPGPFRADSLFVDIPYLTERLRVRIRSRIGLVVRPWHVGESTVIAMSGQMHTLDLTDSTKQSNLCAERGGEVVWETNSAKLGYQYRIFFRVERI